MVIDAVRQMRRMVSLEGVPNIPSRICGKGCQIASFLHISWDLGQGVPQILGLLAWGAMADILQSDGGSSFPGARGASFPRKLKFAWGCQISGGAKYHL